MRPIELVSVVRVAPNLENQKNLEKSENFIKKSEISKNLENFVKFLFGKFWKIKTGKREKIKKNHFDWKVAAQVVQEIIQLSYNCNFGFQNEFVEIFVGLRQSVLIYPPLFKL